MSKLADKIRSAARSEPQPLGFGAARASVTATMVLAGAARDPAAAADLAKRGADVVLVGSAKTAAKLGGGKDVTGAIPGARIGATAANEATQFREDGYDFVVFDPNAASATALLDEKVGYVLALPDNLSDNEIRTLESFQLDAIDVGALSTPLTVRRQIELRRIFALTRKPLMASVDGAISVIELQALRDTNVLVVIADSPESVEKLRNTIEALPPRSRRKDDDRPTPLVPHNAMAEEESDEHDHEHD